MTKNDFLRSGDIGYVDDDGFVFVVDRAKELIKYKGHGVAPAELEEILNHHPDIMDSCCVHGQDVKGEEIPKAFIVLKHPDDPSAPTPDETSQSRSRRREVQFIDMIPRTRRVNCCTASCRSLKFITNLPGLLHDCQQYFFL
ncbi:hypothetical protein V7S43_012136 [Phytophthora oleae]|uniref:AMP-binding enzyme C-terminal domain-containing protein n=1 Tax=Phytophthora oleae TaxID=2107226 RepID=A0ABD3F791_9STRA